MSYALAPPPPPPVHALRAGHQLHAGLGMATILPDLDFETYSEAGYVYHVGERKWIKTAKSSNGRGGLPAVGVAVYATHPSTEILCLAYDLKDGRGKRRWRPGQPLPLDLLQHIRAGGLIEAFNSAFEWWIWNCVGIRYGFPPLPLRQVRCAQAKGRAWSMPPGLDDVASVLGIPGKHPEGAALMKIFSSPRNPTKADPRLRHTLDDLPEQGGRYADYNEQDIVVEASVSARVPDLSPIELEYWLEVDRPRNVRGVAIDVEGVDNCIALIEECHAKYNYELAVLTSGAVRKGSELQKMIGWLAGRSFYIDSLDDDHVQDALKRMRRYEWLAAHDWRDEDGEDRYLAYEDLHGVRDLPAVKRALEIRQAVGSASVKKVYAMRGQVTARGRLHELFAFHGARTGRPTGAGPQPTNLPNSGPATRLCPACARWTPLASMTCTNCLTLMPPPKVTDVTEWNIDAAEDALRDIATRSLTYVEMRWGDAMGVLSGCLRPLFVAAPGHDLICSDYSAIEAVVNAALSGEQWRLDVFFGDGKIYEASAATMFHKPLEELLQYKRDTDQHHPLRKKGKVAELACLSADTLVLTDRGLLAIVDVQLTDKLWDGAAWVTHGGLIARGERTVVNLDGIRTTPDHRFLCRHSWKEASELASSGRALSQALATGSARLPSWSATAGRVGPGLHDVNALAASSPRFRSGTCSKERPRDAGNVLASPQPRRAEASLPPSSTTRQNGGSTHAYTPPSTDVTTRNAPGTRTTGHEAFPCTENGGRIDENFLSTSSPLKGGTPQNSTWIGSTTTEGMNRETSDSSHASSTWTTADPSRNYSEKSTDCEPVFDILNAGPYNRFTIKSDSGYLIAHNCGYLGWIGALRAMGYEGSDAEAAELITAWRKASPSIVFLGGGQKAHPAMVAFHRYAVAAGGVDLATDPVWATTKVLVANVKPWDCTEPYLYGLEGGLVQALTTPGTLVPVLRLDGTHSGLSWICQGDVLDMILPDETTITYHLPRLHPAEKDWRGLAISFEGYNTNPKSGPIGWITMWTYAGKLLENCIAEGTLVLTDSGWKPIETVTLADKVHDGVEFVRHAGTLFKSVQTCIRVDGVAMTPDHEVLNDAGIWQAASQILRPHRPTLRHADGAMPGADDGARAQMVLPMRLRRALSEVRLGHQERRAARAHAELRLLHEAPTGREKAQARHERAPGLRGMALDVRSLPASVASGVAQLRRAGHHGLRALANGVRAVLGGHGADLPVRAAAGPAGQRRGVQPRKLPLGTGAGEREQQARQPRGRHAGGPHDHRGSEHDLRDRALHASLPGVERMAPGAAVRPRRSEESRRVYDVLDCGPRHRFVVRGDSGPMVVHNCCQAVANRILRHGQVRLERAGYPIVLDVYDENVSEVPEGFGSIEAFEDEMNTMPYWARTRDGRFWPIKAKGGWRGKRYRK